MFGQLVVTLINELVRLKASGQTHNRTAACHTMTVPSKYSLIITQPHVGALAGDKHFLSSLALKREINLTLFAAQASVATGNQLDTLLQHRHLLHTSITI